MKIVKSLLLHGATTSVLDANGVLFCLPEFGGVWQEISVHRLRHSNHIFNFITRDSKKNLAALMKIWLVSFLSEISVCSVHCLRDLLIKQMHVYAVNIYGCQGSVVVNILTSHQCDPSSILRIGSGCL